MNSGLKILKFFLIWRIFLFIPIILGSLILTYNNSPFLFEISQGENLPDYLNINLLTNWSNFDGVHYFNIAERGYKGEARFFPLFSILIFLLSLGNIFYPFTYFIAIITPNIFLIASLIIFYRLLRLDYSENEAFDSIKYLLIFPTAFFLVAVYTESLFILLLFSTFLLARKKKWKWAIMTALLLGTTRIVGIFILPALIIEFLIQNKTLKLKHYLTLLILTVTIPLGLVAYSVFNYFKWGSFLFFLTAQTDLSNGRTDSSLIFPLQTMFRYLKILIAIPTSQFEWWIALVEVSCFLFGVIFLLVAWKKRIRYSYLVFSVLAFLMPSFSGTFSGLPRYVLVVFPIFIALALVKSKLIKSIYMATGVIGLFILLMFFARGYFIA